MIISEFNPKTTTMRLAITIKELADALQISMPTAYDLVHRDGFPSIEIGRKIIIPIEPLKKWLMDTAFTNSVNNNLQTEE
jgi:excisionase family DNA binding protein